jgi:hypothetical protein
MLVLTTISGIVLQRVAKLQPGTALLGTLPGGAGEMIAMSDSLGADVRLVTVMQYGRLLAILVTISIVGHFAGASAGGGHPVTLAAAVHPVAPLHYLISAIIALIGAMIGTGFRIPAGTIIIPAALAGVAGIIGVPAAPWPAAVLAAAYLVFGLQIGSQFDATVVEQLKRLGFLVVLSNFFLLAASAVLAIVLTPVLKIDLLSAYLAATPGGLDSVAAMATDLRADAALILAVHSLRLISVLIVGPFLVQIVARRLVTDG